MNGSSNIDDVERWIQEQLDKIDFTRAGVEESLGRDLAGVVAQGIVDRSRPDAMDPSGGTWADNKEPYKSRKAKKYDAYQPGVLTGQMLSLTSMLGETTITSDQVEMRYGINKPSTDSLNGQPPPKAANPPTDRQKAQWFTEGGRAFYALDQTIADKVIEAAEEAVPNLLKD